jgi:hypothetical protein
MHGINPSTVFPKISKRKRDKKTFCLRFAHMLDHHDQHPHFYDPVAHPDPNKPSPFLSLPAELRQSILRHVLDEQTIYDPRPSQQTRDLGNVCRTFAADLIPTMKQWDKDEAELRVRFGTERAAMSDYIQDLMKPIVHAANALPRRRPKKRSCAAARRARLWSEMASR